jgi:hypothetical protein
MKTSFLSPNIQILPNEVRHAERIHGGEATLAKQTLASQGFFESWKEPNGNVHLLTQHPVLGIYDVIAVRRDNVWHEVSAFMPKNGRYQTVKNWLMNKRCKKAPIGV